MLNRIKNIHHTYVFLRRVNVLSDSIAKVLPDKISVLDVGCGDGTISHNIQGRKNDVRYEGIDIMPRPTCSIPYKTYDGNHFLYHYASVDVVQFVDVLHHTTNIESLIKEAARTTKQYIVIKDHEYATGLDYQILKFMDWVGNAPHGVKVIYNFKRRSYWEKVFSDANLEIVSYTNDIPLYPFPFNLVFGRKLHFIALLKKK